MPKAVSDAIEYAKHRSRSHDALIRVYDEAATVIEPHEQGANWTLSIRQPIFDDMMANEQTSVSRVADREKLPLLLDKARQFAGQYIDSLEESPVFPGEKSLRAMHTLVEPLPENPSDPFVVLDQLQEIGAPAVVTQTGGRYFGFVNGGILPVGLAARWMADVWDQNTAHYVMSPINSRLEEICERWIVSLLGFTEETAAGFVSGTTIANFSGLCAGRNELLRRRGWRLKFVGIRFAAKAGLDVRFRGDAGDIRARRGGCCQY